MREMDVDNAGRVCGSDFRSYEARDGREAEVSFGEKLAEKRAECGNSGERLFMRGWQPGNPFMRQKQDDYWKRREERRKKLQKQYQQKLAKEALARRLAQEQYDAEVSVANARRSRLLWSGEQAGGEERISPAAIEYEANVIAQTMLSSLFRK